MLAGKICRFCVANDEYTLGGNKDGKRFLLHVYWNAHVGITHETTLLRIIYMELKYVGKKLLPAVIPLSPSVEERLNTG